MSREIEARKPMPPDPHHPNILLIVTDQQRGDCLGLDGHPVVQTPNMDWIGASGTRFRRGYAECPSCIPARRTLMSGQAPATNGMVGFLGGVPFDPPATLAGELGRAGYETRMIGKLHLHPRRKRFGFDALELADSTRGAGNDYVDWLHGEVPLDRWAMAHGATPNGWIGRPNHLPEEKTHTFWCVSRAIEFLRKRDPTAPFFLNVSFIDPHPPFTPPAWLFDRYHRMELPEPVIGDWVEPFTGPRRGLDPEGREYAQHLDLDPAVMHACRAAYFGLINHVDLQTGRLIQYLRDSGLLETTFLLFVSDHGEMLGDHHMFEKTRGFDASARVPFLARAPHALGFPREVICNSPVGLQDVMPTLLEIAGADVPSSVTGRSLLPLMRNEHAAWRAVLHGEHSGFNDYRRDSNHFLVDERHKYIWFSQTGRELLFDLEADPLETNDVSAERDLEPWRGRLVQALRDRPEGFTDGRRLIPGRPHDHMVPGLAPPGLVMTRRIRPPLPLRG